MIYFDSVDDFKIVMNTLEEEIYDYKLSWVINMEIYPLKDKFVQVEDFPFSIIIQSHGNTINSIIEFANKLELNRFLLIEEYPSKSIERFIPIMSSVESIGGNLGEIIAILVKNQKHAYSKISRNWSNSHTTNYIPSVQEHIRHIILDLGVEDNICKLLKLNDNEYPIFDIS